MRRPEVSEPALGVLLLFTTPPTDRALRGWHWELLWGSGEEGRIRAATGYITRPYSDEHGDEREEP